MLLLVSSIPAFGQTAPPVQFDANIALRAYDQARRTRIQEQNARSYAEQTETYAGGAKQEHDAAELDQAQNILVGRLIAAGNCADARRVALGEGRFDLVDRVAALCTAAPPQ
jgi:hypothetical protein